MHGTTSSQDEETYFRTWRKLSIARLYAVDLHVQLLSTGIYYGPELEARIVWGKEVVIVANRLTGIMEQLNAVERVRQEKLSEFLLRL